jgi:hypothetical protein
MKKPGPAWAFLLCLAVAPSPAAQARQAAPPPEGTPSATLSWLAGTWRGAGTMFGNASEASLEVRPALDGRFLELRYHAGRFEGRAFYRPLGEGRWQAQWFDNRGITFGIEAVAGERILTSDWGSAETERGRTIYRLLVDGRLEVTDMVAARDGSTREFARHVLQKTD